MARKIDFGLSHVSFSYDNLATPGIEALLIADRIAIRKE